jgi:hypothetical protein
VIGPLLPSSGEHLSGMHARTQVGLTRHRVAICVAHPKAAFMNNCLAPCWADSYCPLLTTLAAALVSIIATWSQRFSEFDPLRCPSVGPNRAATRMHPFS